MAKKQPTYDLVVTSKENTKAKTYAGAVFENEWGTYNLRLSPGVVLHWNDEVFLQLKPHDSSRFTRDPKTKVQRESEHRGEAENIAEDDGELPIG